jgi:4-hydroxy-2-oxoheptanedioate aldolase
VNRVIELLEKGVRPYGVFVNDTSDHNARWLAKSPADFALMCMEHHPLDPLGIRRFIQSTIDRASMVRTGSLQFKPAPMVRVPITGREVRSNHWVVKQVLDSGVCGLVFPMIETAEEAEAAVAACRYSLSEDSPREIWTKPDAGDFHEQNTTEHYGRSAGPKFARWLWGVPNYNAIADVWPLNPEGEILLAIQIESMKGVRNLDKILDVRGLGAVMIGPGDLRMKMGRSDENDPDVKAVFSEIIQKARAKGVYTMILVSPSNYSWYMSLGVDICIAGFDAGVHSDAQLIFNQKVTHLCDKE